jgi:hypothetical protein
LFWRTFWNEPVRYSAFIVVGVFANAILSLLINEPAAQHGAANVIGIALAIGCFAWWAVIAWWVFLFLLFTVGLPIIWFGTNFIPDGGNPGTDMSGMPPSGPWARDRRYPH